MTAVRSERRVLIGVAAVILLVGVYLVWPRKFQPPLVGFAMGEPVRDTWMGACRRVTYTFPGDYPDFVQKAGLQLRFLRYHSANGYYPYFRNAEDAGVMIYPGKWVPWQTEDGLIDTRIMGWVTVTFDSPPDRWRQTWFAFSLRFHRNTTKAATARKAGP